MKSPDYECTECNHQIFIESDCNIKMTKCPKCKGKLKEFNKHEQQFQEAG